MTNPNPEIKESAMSNLKKFIVTFPDEINIQYRKGTISWSEYYIALHHHSCIADMQVRFEQLIHELNNDPNASKS